MESGKVAAASYGFAALVGAAIAESGGVGAGIIVFWIGGALATVGALVVMYGRHVGD